MAMTVEHLALDLEKLWAEVRALKAAVQPVIDMHKPEPTENVALREQARRIHAEVFPIDRDDRP